jgi:hypothetical protein
LNSCICFNNISSSDYQTNDTVQTVVNNYQEIVELLKKYPECKLTFLEIPPYSIHSWNLYQKHPDVDQFKSDDDQFLDNCLPLFELYHLFDL